MKLAVITDSGEIPIRSEDLADEICKRVGFLTTRGRIRRALIEIEMQTKQPTEGLGLEHR